MCVINSHCRVPVESMSSSMSSRSSDSSRCWGTAGRIPRKAGSRLRAEARDDMPGLLTTLNPVRISICCHRWSFSLRAAVTSPRACLQKWERKRGEVWFGCSTLLNTKVLIYGSVKNIHETFPLQMDIQKFFTLRKNSYIKKIPPFGIFIFSCAS